jgi:hypothetical protein
VGLLLWALAGCTATLSLAVGASWVLWVLAGSAVGTSWVLWALSLSNGHARAG